MVDLELQIIKFVRFWKNNATKKMILQNGVLTTEGCTELVLPDPGCCGQSLDISDLANTLEELVGHVDAKLN